MGEGLGPAQDDVVGFEEPRGGPYHAWGVEGEWGGKQGREVGGGEGEGIDM